jgi:hypothetical protein
MDCSMSHLPEFLTLDQCSAFNSFSVTTLGRRVKDGRRSMASMRPDETESADRSRVSTSPCGNSSARPIEKTKDFFIYQRLAGCLFYKGR